MCTVGALGAALSSATARSQWSFSETSGATVFDSAGGNHGTLVNGVARIAGGQVGPGLSFDGVDDYVAIGDSPTLEASQFSVSVWVRRNGAQVDWAKILSKGRTDIAPFGSYKLEFNGSSDTVVNWHLGTTDGTGATVQNTTPLPDQEWTHLVGTYNRKAMKLYVNGTLAAARKLTKAVRFDSTPLTVGGYDGWSYFRGDIDEVKYFNYALSDEDVRSAFEEGASLTVTQPNTNVDWMIGSVQSISWMHDLGAATTSRVDLSRDGGSTWTTLAGGVPNASPAGHYSWTVTGPSTTRARVRVQAEQVAAGDISDVDFHISTPTMMVTSPNGPNDVWAVDQPATVTWSSNLGAAEQVRIDLSTDGGGTFPITIAASTPSDGSETVMVPPGWETETARVRIRWLRDLTVSDVSDANSRISPAALVNVAFQSSTEIFANPERGFFVGGDLLTQTSFSYVRAQGRSLMRSYVRLDAYRNSPLPASLLSQLNTGFGYVRQAGIKVIVRFSYNFGPYPNSEPDAPQARIEEHLQQLAPILAANVDVISSLEAGFIGAWGEWHTSTNGLDTDPVAKNAILDAILAALPASRMVALRYPSDLQLLNGPPILPAEAYSGTRRARIGNHQDCFLASEDDWGTWGRSGNSYAYDKAYIAENGRFAIVGGETCNPNPPRSDCPTAMAELAYMHWSYLNEQFEPTVVQGFRNGGCFDEMNRRLGYRFALTTASYSGTAKVGTNFRVKFQIANQGFAAMYNARPLFAVLDNGTSKYFFPLAVDPRQWVSGTTSAVDYNLALPSGMAPGTYTLALWLPDEAVALRNSPAYTVRFANTGVWDPATGYNVITRTVTIVQ